MSTASELIKKAKSKVVDHLGRSHASVHMDEIRYGGVLSWRSTASSIDHRSDEAGNVEPYLPDDPEVLAHFFHVRPSEWE